MLQPNTALFEACCNEKIQQFDDSGSDEEVSVCLDSSIILILKKYKRGASWSGGYLQGETFTFIYILKGSPFSEQIRL